MLEAYSMKEVMATYAMKGETTTQATGMESLAKIRVAAAPAMGTEPVAENGMMPKLC